MKMRIVVTLIVAIIANSSAEAARVRAVRKTPNYEPQVRANVLAIANNMLSKYEGADFSLIWKSMESRQTVNALYAVIPISQSMAWVVKYENEGQREEAITKALELAEFSTDLYSQWGQSWASPSVVQVHVFTAHRIRSQKNLPPYIQNRAEILWGKVLSMLEIEANTFLPLGLPTPSDSSTTGDTKAEELAWGATVFTTAAVFLPDNPNAKEWEKKGRQLAYNAITRPSDPPDFEGVKMITVTEEFGVNNHNIPNNPYYSAATLQLLQQAELPYRMMGKPAPAEISHNFMGLYKVYKTYCSVGQDGYMYWNRPSDHGDPTLFPIAKANDMDHDLALSKMRAEKRHLWDDNAVTTGVIPPESFYAAIQNHKVNWYQIVGLYLWEIPTVR